MDGRQMRTYIQNFSFDNCTHGNQGYNRLLLQLFGFTGHGKSCFINSCKYVVDDGEYQIYAPVDRGDGGGKTLKRDPYRLTNNITLVDNRGCAMMNKSETGEIYFQLGNFQPLGQYVTWDTEYQVMLRQLLNEDRSPDFIVPVFIYSALKSIPSHEYNDIKEILTKARGITGIFPAVVITHGSSGNLPQIQEQFRKMGVQHIIPLENYTEENSHMTPQKHEKILKCLREIIKDVESRMEKKRNPREMTDREEILHTFLIEREKERVREKERDVAQAALKKEIERLEELKRTLQRESEKREAEATLQREIERRKEAEAALQMEREKREAEMAFQRERERREAQEAFQRERNRRCILS